MRRRAAKPCSRMRATRRWAALKAPSPTAPTRSWAGFPPPAQAALPRVLRALTTVCGMTGPGAGCAGGAARKLCRRQSGADPGRCIHRGAATGCRERGRRAPTVRLAHEALISRWQRARDQLAADRRDLETRDDVERQFGRWSKARGRARWLLLLRNPDLANAVDLAKRWGDELDAPGCVTSSQRSARRARLAQTLIGGGSGTVRSCCRRRIICRREQALFAQKEAEGASD